MVTLSKKINGFTLVETIVSMIIVMSVFATGLMIMVNIMKSDNHKQRLEAMSILSEVYTRALAKPEFHNETVVYNNLEIVKTYETCEKSDRLINMQIEIKDSKGRTILSRNELLLKHEIPSQ